MVMIFEAPRRLYLRAYRLPYTAVVFPLYPIHFVPTPSYERRINRKSGSLPHEAVGYNQIGHHSITVANANTFGRCHDVWRRHSSVIERSTNLIGLFYRMRRK